MRQTPLDATALWADLQAVRAHAPLVHSITNLVVMNFNANALLAVGASPVMAHAEEEVCDMVGIAQALVLNIGTLEPAWIRAMALALQAARAKGIPVVLDPVGAGATPYRNAALCGLLEIGAPTVVRGNASEIMSVAGLAAATRGVDSAASTHEAANAAQALAGKLGAVVCVSGADDLVVGAFAAVQPDAWRATLAAMACLGVVGEMAVERTQAQGGGVGRLQIELLDGLQLLDRESFVTRLRMVVHGHE